MHAKHIFLSTSEGLEETSMTVSISAQSAFLPLFCFSFFPQFDPVLTPRLH